MGKIEINGKTYDARSSMGRIDKGERVKILKKSDFELLVEKEVTS